MYIDEAEKLRQEWGNKPCDHPHFEREYYHGDYITNHEDKKTNDWICTQCGRDFTDEEKKAIEEERKYH